MVANLLTHMRHSTSMSYHHAVIKWKHFPRYWPYVRGIHRSPVNSPHKGQWRGALVFSLIGARINGWVNKREAGDLRRYHAHYDVIVMCNGLCYKELPARLSVSNLDLEKIHQTRNCVWYENLLVNKSSDVPSDWRLYCQPIAETNFENPC